MRKAQFQVMYEVIGLIVFGITALIWFGGIESIVGGFTGSTAVNSFNKITTAIKNQCMTNTSTMLSGLDLDVFGSTYIMTQLSIPGSFRNDPETMGFIPAQMRKCVDANCLCLMELNEDEGNWQMCTTSDWDTYNFEFGSRFGAPGCPFWYYAPPDVITQSVQTVFDILELSGLDLIMGFVNDPNDAEEKYSYPAPENWGGCSYANEANLAISNFKMKSAELDCANIVTPIKTMFDATKQSILDNFNNEFNKDFIKDAESTQYYNNLVDTSLIKPSVNSLKTEVINDYTNKIDDQLITGYENILTTALESIDFSGLNTYCAGYSSIIADSITNNYLNKNIISQEGASEIILNTGSIAVINFDSLKKPANLDSLNVSINAKAQTIGYDVICDSTEIACSYDGTTLTCTDGMGCAMVGQTIICNKNTLTDPSDDVFCTILRTIPSLNVKLNNCVNNILLNSTEKTTYTTQFRPTCLYQTNNELTVTESHNSEFYSAIINIGNYPSAADFNLIESELTPSVNVTFNDKILNNQVTDYALNKLSESLINQGLKDSGQSLSCTLTDSLTCPDFSCTISNIITCGETKTVCTKEESGYNCGGAELINCNENSLLCDGGCTLEKQLDCDNNLCTYGLDGIECSDGVLCRITPFSCTDYYNLDDYQAEVSTYLTGISFSSVPARMYDNTSFYYNDYFNNFIELTPYITSGDTCIPAFNIRSEILNSYEPLKDHLFNNLTRSFNNLLSGTEVIDKTLKTTGLDYAPEYQLNLATEPFAESMANELINYLPSTCSEADKTIVTNAIKDIISESLDNKNSELTLALHLENNGLSNLPDELIFYDYYADKISETSTKTANDFLTYQQPRIILGSTEIADLISEKVNIRVTASVEPTSVSEVPCWLSTAKTSTKDDSYVSKDGNLYFPAYPNVNDVLAWQQYTSVSRLSPQLMALGLKAVSGVLTLTTKYLVNQLQFVDETVSATERAEGVAEFNENLNYQKANKNYWTTAQTTVTAQEASSFGTTTDAYSSFVQDLKLGNVDIWAVLPSANAMTDASIILDSDYSGITGYSFTSVAKKIFNKASREVIELQIKTFLKNNAKTLVLLAVTVAVNVAVNVWRNTLITNLNEVVVRYADGGIRTFNPEVINVKSCVRMDELGCGSSDAIWVNESFRCQTDIYVRRLAKPETWVAFLKEADRCQNAQVDLEKKVYDLSGATGTAPSVFKRDTMTACYEVSCVVNTADPDRYHVFQYWVGASGDPAGLLGTRYGQIDGLKIYNATAPGKAWNNKIMLEVVGGNETAKIPASIV